MGELYVIKASEGSSSEKLLNLIKTADQSRKAFIVKLTLIKFFFLKLDNKDITYCHWKGNARLNETLGGEGDVDLLFYPDDKPRIEEVFKSIGAKKFEGLPLNKYPDIEDYLAVDPDTGILFHFHVHYGLYIWEKSVKRYSLPWVSDMLENRILHESQPVWIPSHEHEFLLLILRLTLSVPAYKLYFQPQRWRIDKKRSNEFEWLKERIIWKKFSSISDSLMSADLNSNGILREIFTNGLSVEHLSLLRKELYLFRKKNQTCNFIAANRDIIKDKLLEKSGLMLKKSGILFPRKRINVRGGLIVAITGSDGSGKSTTVRNVAEVYKRKIDVQTVYFGLPKPKKSSFPLLIKLIKYIYLYPFWNLFMKKRNLRRALNFRKNGILVLCDRFPQAMYEGIMDGPLLSKWKKSLNPVKRSLSYLSNTENRIFESINKTNLDIVIKLKVDAETSAARGRYPIQIANEKVKIMEDLHFPNARHVSNIDTSVLNEAETAKKVINIIWNKIP